MNGAPGPHPGGFFAALEARARTLGSLLCVGLDPHLEQLPSGTARDALALCTRLVEQTRDVALAYKPNAAFFEALGPDGMRALAELIARIGPDVPVILDVKRGDIASTAAAYARAAFEGLGAGAVTLSPYMGWETVQPWLAHPGTAVFLLCRTSNPGGADLQEARLSADLDGPCERLFERVAGWVADRGAADRVGLVVGATRPDALAAVRARAPAAWILAPGVGPQGADLEAALRAGRRADGLGLLLNASRAIAGADDPRAAAIGLRDQIRCAAQAVPDAKGAPAWAPPPRPPLASLARGLLEAGCVRFGDFELKSGLRSPIYVDLRQLTGHPQVLAAAARAMAPCLDHVRHTHGFDRLAALPYAGLPLGTALSLERGWPLIFPRARRKAHGTGARVEGPFAAGERAVMVDDLATRGTSAREAAVTLRAAGLTVEDLVVLIDRGSGAARALGEDGVRLHAACTLGELLPHWRGGLTNGQIDEVRAFLRETGG